MSLIAIILLYYVVDEGQAFEYLATFVYVIEFPDSLSLAHFQIKIRKKEGKKRKEKKRKGKERKGKERKGKEKKRNEKKRKEKKRKVYSYGHKNIYLFKRGQK